MNLNLGIDMSQYQNNPDARGEMDVFSGDGNSQALADLQKALEAGEISGNASMDSTTASGAPLKVEALDKTLKLITFREQDIVLWKKIPKMGATNTVEEYNQLTSYGAERGGFILEGELPQEEDSTYVRRSQLVKFMGVTMSVTHPMQLVNTMIGNVVQRQIQNGTMWILRKLNRAMTKANSLYVPEEFNGFYAQHQFNDQNYSNLNAYYNGNDVVIDLRGSALTESAIERACEAITENFGRVTDIFAPPKVLSGFVQSFYGNKFIVPNTPSLTAATMGQKVQKFQSQFGDIDLNYDLFMNKGNRKAYNSPATHPNAPAVVTSTSVTPIAATVADSLWASTDAGTYYFGVVPINRYGEGAFTNLDASLNTIVTNGSVDLTFTPGVSANNATAFVIYRSNKAPASLATAVFYPMFTVSLAEYTAGYDGASAGGKVRDNNRIMPNTDQCFVTGMDEEVMSYKQLAPLMKMDLAVISPAYRFMVLQYGTPMLYAPRKFVRIINVGTN